MKYFVGQRVKDLSRDLGCNNGTIISTTLGDNHRLHYCVLVKFDDGSEQRYDLEGSAYVALEHYFAPFNLLYPVNEAPFPILSIVFWTTYYFFVESSPKEESLKFARLRGIPHEIPLPHH